MAEYSISQLSKEFDITTRTIRHYEDLGLLAPARRGQTRIYSPADRTRLRLILRGKRLGLSLWMTQGKLLICMSQAKPMWISLKN